MNPLRLRLFAPAVLFAAAVGLAGCSSDTQDVEDLPSTEGLSVAELSPSMSIEARGETVTVYAALHRGGDFRRLGTGDSLTVVVSGERIPMRLTPSSSEAGAKPRYTASFPLRPNLGEIVVAFERPAGLADAKYTRARLVPFTPGELREPIRVKRSGFATKLPVTPAPPAGVQASVSLDGPCFRDDKIFATSGGESALALTYPSPGSEATAKVSDACTARATVRYTSYGEADSAFARGLFGVEAVEAFVERSFDVQLVPSVE